jgi:hypothetical protein
MSATGTWFSIALLCLVSASGCVRPVWPGSDRYFPPADVLPRAPGRDTPRGPIRDTTYTSSEGRRPGVSSKLVYAKESPSTLIARDASRCVVTAKRFAETREGEEAWCIWTNGQ